MRKRTAETAAFLLLPGLLCIFLDSVPKFIYAACSYYCSPTAITLTAMPSHIAVDESSIIEAFNADCPCSWQIVTQPGAWALEDLGNCKVRLKPVSTFGNPGPIDVKVTALGGCTKTITVNAGCDTLWIQGSLDDGANWLNDSMVLLVTPGSPKSFAVRVVMTTGRDLDGWSYSVEHDEAQLEAAGGDLEVTSVTTAGTHTAGVQGGGAPAFESTLIRQDRFDEVVGFTQGVAIDFNGTIKQPPVVRFVTAGACFQVTAPPSAGTYTATLSFVDDLGEADGPGVRTILAAGPSVTPCLRGFTVHVVSTSGQAETSCGSVDWVLQGDGAAGPETPPSGGGGGSTGEETPFCGNVNGDLSIDLADPIFLLNHLFLGGPAPMCLDFMDADQVVQTGQLKCYNNTAELAPCPAAPAAAFFGQDGFFAAASPDAGLSRSFIKRKDTIANGNQIDVVWDLRYGLQWSATFFGGGCAEVVSAQEQIDSNLGPEWRVPTVRELQSLLDYSRMNLDQAAVDNQQLFDLEPPTGCSHWWAWTSSSTSYNEDYWYTVNVETGQIGADLYEGVSPAVQNLILPVKDIGPPVLPGGALCADVNDDNQVDIADPLFLLLYLFVGGQTPPCVVRAEHLLNDAPNDDYPNRPPMPARFQVDMTEQGQPTGTVTDLRTGLMWERTPGLGDQDKNVTWAAALDRAKIRDTGGNFDWRLPNVSELLSLLDYQLEVELATPQVTSLIQTPAFDPDLASGVVFWTSTTLADSQGSGSTAYAVDIVTGYVSYEPLTPKTELHRVWAVREGRRTP